VLLGRLQAVRTGTLVFAGDLEATLAEGDEAFSVFRRTVDEYVLAHGLDVPEDETPERSAEFASLPLSETLELGLHEAGIGSVVWATGFRYDFGWIEFPVFDETGEPVHRRGVTAVPGLYFLGLRLLHKPKSSFMMGADEDAAHLAEQIAARG
jgi:putative flavoprotein involved in K+ transport